MGAMTNAMGSIGGAINKVGKGAIGGVNKVGGQMGVPGLGGKPPMQQPGQPGAVPGQPPGQVAVGPTAATAQPGEGGAPPQATGPAGPQVGGQIAPGAGGAPPFLGGLPGLMRAGGLQKPPGQLTATGALGKQPAQTTMQKMMGQLPKQGQRGGPPADWIYHKNPGGGGGYIPPDRKPGDMVPNGWGGMMPWDPNSTAIS